MSQETIKKIHLLEHKLQIIDNDMFKLVSNDLLYSLEHEDFNAPKNFAYGYIEILKRHYKNQLHELRQEQKGITKQKDLEEEIKEVKNTEINNTMIPIDSFNLLEKPEPKISNWGEGDSFPKDPNYNYYTGKK